MKNGLLIWNILLTIVAGYLLFARFSTKKTEAETPAEPRFTSAAKDTGSAKNSFRIAYFEMDSVENNYQLVKDVQAEIDKKEKQYNNDLAQLEIERTKKIDNYQQEISHMSREDLERMRLDMNQFDDNIKDQKEELKQSLQDFITKQQLYLKSTIKDFLKEYNKDNYYAYIFVNEQGLFYYCDTVYNITGDVIKGLNEMYKKNRKG